MRLKVERKSKWMHTWFLIGLNLAEKCIIRTETIKYLRNSGFLINLKWNNNINKRNNPKVVKYSKEFPIECFINTE